MNRTRAATVALAAVVLVLGSAGVGVRSLATAADPGTCDPVAIVDHPDSQTATVSCEIPKATSTVTSTVTATETVTETVTVPGPTTTVTVTETATVTASPTPSPTPTPTATPAPSPTTTAPAPAAAKKLIGMSAPAADWAARLAEVGTQGLKARRIFADLTPSGTDQSSLITAAHNAGMMPVVSFKVPSFTDAATGAYDAWADNAAAFLASFGKPTAVVVWHEPNGDMTGPQFVAMQERLVPHFKGVGQLKVGPILNGFLLTQPSQPAGVNQFASYTSPSLMAAWDFFGIDTYQPGTQSSPGTLMPDTRIYALEDWLDGQGRPDMPIAVGEYNGFSGAAIAGVGEALLSLPEVWFGCVWNSAAARAGILTGDRLTAFKATKADPRAQQ